MNESKLDDERASMDKGDLSRFCISSLRELAINESFVHRQSFCLIIVSFLEFNTIFTKGFAQYEKDQEFRKLLSTDPESIFSLFIKFERDRVSNVRSSLYRSLQTLTHDNCNSMKTSSKDESSYVNKILLDMTNRLRVEEEGWWR